MKTYCFYDRLTSEYPSQIIIDVTEQCNLSCVHCPHGNFVKSSNYTGKKLSKELHDKLIEDVRSSSNGSCQYLRYTAAGEPLTHPDIFIFLESAKKYSNVAISLTTNGTMLNNKARKKIIEIGIDVIDISIDAFSEEVYSSIRRGGNRNKVYANVQNLIKERTKENSKLRIATTFIEQKNNIHERDVFKQFWEEAGADYVIFRRLHSCAGEDETIAAQLRDANASIVRYPCLYPWERLVLTPHGRLAFCPANWNHAAEFAEFENTTISEAWQGRFMNDLRSAHLNNDFTNFQLCGQCPDWACTRWPSEGRSFADMIQDIKADA